MYFAALYRPGPERGNDQTIWEEHIAYMQQLLAKGKLLMGGPFTDTAGEARMMAILKVETPAEAAALVANDPVVRSNVVIPEVRPWNVMLKVE